MRLPRPRASRRGAIAAAVAAPWAVWALVRGFGLDGGHPLVGAMAFTPYAAATAFVPVVLALVLRTWIVAGVALASALALGLAVLPRAIDGPHVAGPDDPGRRVVVMTSNQLFGRADARSIVRLVREHRVDVLSLQELTPEAVQRLDAAGIRQLLPGRVLDPRPTARGSGLMARAPLRRVTATGPGVFAQPEAAVRLPDGIVLRLKVVHPIPPITRSGAARWRETLRGLPGPRAGAVARLLLGDFNATVDHREMRRVLDRGFYDAADATGDGLRATWPVNRRRPMITIDHVLVPLAIRTGKVSVHDVPGSDHRTLIAELVLPT